MSVLQVIDPLGDDILAYLDQWEGTTRVNVTVPAMTVVLSPATVRLVLNSIRSLDIGHVSKLAKFLSPSPSPQCPLLHSQAVLSAIL